MASSPLRVVLACALILGLGTLAPAATIKVDDFSGNRLATPVVTRLPPDGTSTSPPGTFTEVDGGATMTFQSSGNGDSGIELQWDFPGIDLTDGGLNAQFFLEFVSIARTNTTWQPAMNITVYAVDTNNVEGVYGSSIPPVAPFDMVFNFNCAGGGVCFSPNPNWTRIRQIRVRMVAPVRPSPEITTVILDIVRATPPGGGPPQPPTPNIAAPAFDCAAPANFTVDFSSWGQAASVTGLTVGEIQVSGNAPGTKTAALSGSGSSYSVAVSGMTGPGTVGIQIPANVARDTWDQDNFASDLVETYFGTSPAFTSAASSTFLAGSNGSFALTASGSPAPTFSITGGSLPTGLTLSGSSISGTPGAATGGQYALTLRATNGCSFVSQSHTLTVNQAPAITSAASATFQTGSPGNFSVTKTGYPAVTLSFTGSLPSGVTFNTGTGVIAGTPGAGMGGSYPLTITASNGVNPNAVQNFTLTVNQPSAITSANATTFKVGDPGSFTVTRTGFPAPTVSVSGTLPGGVTFDPATRVLAGTPDPGTGGTYPLTFTASNGVGADAVQSFTLTVNQAPAITSAASTQFTTDAAGSFTVTKTGFPAPTLGMSGSLPSGVGFVPATGILSGTPAVGTVGAYPLVFTASNGVTPTATQAFTLIVNTPPAFTSAALTTFTTGSAGSFTVTVVGEPLPGITHTGTLPSGVGFVDNGDRTATLAGTPAPGTGGTYPLTFKASNGAGPGATVNQGFTLTVHQGPAITSAAATTFVAGTPGSFSVTRTGTPTPTVTVTGTLPTGVTLNPTSGLLAGTPGTGTAGVYPVTLTAGNGVGADATQAFTLTVHEAPAITSAASTTFTTLVPGSFTFESTGLPFPGLGLVGTLPSGVSFVDEGDGTGTLSGTPAAGTGASYPLTLTASNGVGTNAVQAFTLLVNQPPEIVSAAATTFQVGTTGTFTVTRTGFPVPALTRVGSLPAGISFTTGTGLLAGTPAASTGGTYPLTFTASNGLSPIATQEFLLTIHQAPAITSLAATTFTTGVAGSFTVTRTGFPAPTLALAGTLPGGVTFTPGTGLLAGTPTAGTGGTYPLVVTAANGVTPTATQAFTLTVNQSPGITSAAATTFKVGDLGSFTVTRTGFPLPTLGLTGSLPTGVTFATTSGVLSGTPADGTGGTYAVTITAANGVGSDAVQSFLLTVDEPPEFTSSSATTFTTGVAGSFTVAASGFPAPGLSRTGTLPTGVSFTPGTGQLAGTPAAGTGGTYPLVFTAANGVTPIATQPFTLTVNQSSGITSPATTTFLVGAPGSFSVTRTGFPTPTLSLSGTLPSGVSFTPATGLLAGTPGAGTAADYPVTITASNGVGAAAVQAFTLVVNQLASITSTAATTFTTLVPGSFSVTTAGRPTPSLALAGALPTGVTFTDNGNGTATLAGTPAAGTGATYPVTLTASNPAGPDATQAFTLTVVQPPEITSANGTTFTVAVAGSFPVVRTGFPLPTLTRVGALPTGVTFDPVTGLLAGTPGTGTAATYPLTFTAANGIGSAWVQAFTLLVDQAPAIVSPSSANFTQSVSGTFTVTATGAPLPGLVAVGALPSGLTFTDHGDGTATLAGTPAPGSFGTYPLTITASNGVGSDAVQAFTLYNAGPPDLTLGGDGEGGNGSDVTPDDTQVADGVASVTKLITIRDSGGRAVEDVLLRLTSSRAADTITTISARTDNLGQARFLVRSNRAGTSTYSAFVGTRRLQDTAATAWTNATPVADAGPDQAVPPGTATLSAAGSSDVNGDPLTFAWTQLAGPPVTLATPGAVSTAVGLLAAGPYVFEVTASDASAADTDTVTVTVDDVPPVADAGPDFTMQVGTPQALDGTSSADGNGDPLGFTWAEDAGNPASGVLGATDVAQPALAPTTIGVYRFTLVVDDGGQGSPPDEVLVTVQAPADLVPVAYAGPDLVVPVGAVQTLSGAGSVDPDGGTLAGFAWSEDPTNPATGILSTPGAVSTTLTPPLAGLYRFRLTVVDDELQVSAPDEVVLTAQAPGNSVPAACAVKTAPSGPATVGTPMTLSAACSGEADGDALTYRWDLVFPHGELGLGTGVTLGYTPLMAGPYRFRLTVDDGTFSVWTLLEVPVSAPGEVPPRTVPRFTDTLGNASTNGQGTSAVGATVTLDAVASDADGDPLTFLWSQLAGPSALLTSPTTSTPSFLVTTSGTYGFEVHVSDGVNTVSGFLVLAAGAPGRRPPVAVQVAAVSAAPGATVVLDGTGSFDPDGDPITHFWSQFSGAPVLLAAPASVAPSFVTSQVGTYVFAHLVSDGTFVSLPGKVTVTIAVPGAPVVGGGGGGGCTAGGAGEAPLAGVLALLFTGLGLRWGASRREDPPGAPPGRAAAV